MHAYSWHAHTYELTVSAGGMTQLGVLVAVSNEQLPEKCTQHFLPNVQAALEDDDVTDGVDGVKKEEEGVSVDVVIESIEEAAVEPAAGMSAPSVLPATNTIQQQVATPAVEPASLASAQAAVKETDTKEQLGSVSAAACEELAGIVAERSSSVTTDTHVKHDSTAEAEQSAAADKHAEADGQPSASEPASSACASSREGVKAASAPVTPATAAAEQNLTAPDAKAAAFAAMGSASALHRPSSAPTRRLKRKSSPAPASPEQASPEDSTAPAPARRVSPDSAPVCIPLGKAAELKGSPPAKRARRSPPEPARAAPAAAGPRAAATTPAAQARAAKLSKRAKEPSKLQLDTAQRRRRARSRAPVDAKQCSASLPQQPESARAPAQPQGLNGLHAQASPADEQAPSMVPPAQEQQASGVSSAEARLAQPVQVTQLAEQPTHEAAGQPAVVALNTGPAASSAGKRGTGPMAYLLDKPRAASPTVTAITAPRPTAAMDHRLSRLTDSSQDSVLTGVTQKGEESPEAMQERRQLQKQQEQDRKARVHQKVLKQVVPLKRHGSTSRHRVDRDLPNAVLL